MEIEIIPHRIISHQLIDEQIQAHLKDLRNRVAGDLKLPTLPAIQSTKHSTTSPTTVTSPRSNVLNASVKSVATAETVILGPNSKTTDYLSGSTATTGTGVSNLDSKSGTVDTTGTHTTEKGVTVTDPICSEQNDRVASTLAMLIRELERLEQRPINMDHSIWPQQCAAVIERLNRFINSPSRKYKIVITEQDPVAGRFGSDHLKSSNNISPFYVLALIYESHCFLENLWATKMLPVWNDINSALESVSAAVNTAEGGTSAAVLPSGLQKVVTELTQQKQRWHEK